MLAENFVKKKFESQICRFRDKTNFDQISSQNQGVLYKKKPKFFISLPEKFGFCLNLGNLAGNCYERNTVRKPAEHSLRNAELVNSNKLKKCLFFYADNV